MSEKLPLRHGWPHWPCWNFPLLGDNAILHILFVAYLMAQSVNETYDVECCDDRNRFVRKPLWSNLTDCPRICLDGLKEITRKLGQGSQCPDLWQNGCLTNISQLLTAWINLVEFTFWGRGGERPSRCVLSNLYNIYYAPSIHNIHQTRCNNYN